MSFFQNSRSLLDRTVSLVTRPKGYSFSAWLENYYRLFAGQLYGGEYEHHIGLIDIPTLSILYELEQYCGWDLMKTTDRESYYDSPNRHQARNPWRTWRIIPFLAVKVPLNIVRACAGAALALVFAPIVGIAIGIHHVVNYVQRKKYEGKTNYLPYETQGTTFFDDDDDESMPAANAFSPRAIPQKPRWSRAEQADPSTFLTVTKFKRPPLFSSYSEVMVRTGQNSRADSEEVEKIILEGDWQKQSIEEIQTELSKRARPTAVINAFGRGVQSFKFKPAREDFSAPARTVFYLQPRTKKLDQDEHPREAIFLPNA